MYYRIPRCYCPLCGSAAIVACYSSAEKSFYSSCATCFAEDPVNPLPSPEKWEARNADLVYEMGEEIVKMEKGSSYFLITTNQSGRPFVIRK